MYVTEKELQTMLEVKSFIMGAIEGLDWNTTKEQFEYWHDFNHRFSEIYNKMDKQNKKQNEVSDMKSRVNKILRERSNQAER